MRQIVCLSTSNYYPFPTRKQNVMQRLRDAQVLYFDPPVTLLAPLKDKSAWARLWAWAKKPAQPLPHIRVYALPPVLPFFNKVRFLNRFNQKNISRYIRRRMKQEGFSQPLLWCYSPNSADAIGHLPHQALIYDCVDRHSGYSGLLNPALVDEMERDLATQADLVFCTAAGLYDTLSQQNPHTYLIPNGANYALFSQAAGDKKPADSRQVLGFVGMLQDCIDYELLLAAAQAFPQAELRLIGRVMPGVDVSALSALPNVNFVGLVPQEQLPAQMREFDLCLNVFAAGRLSRDVSPLKFYEYLATGLPVVSTPEPVQVRDYEGLIYIAEDKASFLEACRQALSENAPDLRRRRQEAGAAASWERRVAQMEERLAEAGL